MANSSEDTASKESASRLVTIIGGSGFVGRYIAQAMARRGWRVRVACRHPEAAEFVRAYGTDGQVEPVACNIRDDASVRSALSGADAAVNCVGLLWEDGDNRFDAVHSQGAARVARIAAEEGAGAMVQISAIGADAKGVATYATTKAAGEAAVLDAFPGATVLRPSIIFGTEDGFFNLFAAMARYAPVLPVPGATTKFQPVWVEDVAEAAAKALCKEAEPGLYELGGPRIATLRECLQLMCRIIQRRRLIVNVPFFFARLQASVLQLTARIGIKPVMTVDQVRMLEIDNVVADGAKGFSDLGIQPTEMEGILESYLYAYRANGQYTAPAGSGSAPQE
ncbi:MAG: complex I NDUFA9 subunit family protein [Pseudomonadota bacterium]